MSSALPQLLRLTMRNHLRRHLAFVHQPADAQARLQPERDLGLHVRELLLHQLRRRERPVELLAVERILPRAVQAVLGRTYRAPRRRDELSPAYKQG